MKHNIPLKNNQDFNLIYLHITAITKVMAGSTLLIAQEKVGDVSFNPA
jgi:hypothetical protein